MRIALLFVMLAASVALAEPPAVVPVPPPKAGEWSEVKAAPGRLLRLTAQPASKWLLVDESADLQDYDAGKSAAFVAAVPGRYRLIVTSPDGMSARVVVVVGDAPHPPEPPAPDNGLKVKLKASFDADTGTDKRESAKLLVELYRQLAEKVCPDKSILTAGALLLRARDVSMLLLKPEQLPGVRGVVAKELGALFPADGPLTDEQRAKAAALFTNLAKILGEF